MTDTIRLPVLCLMCGAVVTPNLGRGRPRLYCSTQCRQRAYMARHFAVDVYAIIERWGDDCYLCGELVNLDEPFGPKMANVDHIIPLSRGGATDLSNLRLVHYACNLRKSAGYVCPNCAEPLR